MAGSRRDARAWTHAEEEWLAQVAHLMDADALGVLFGRTGESVRRKCAELRARGIDARPKARRPELLERCAVCGAWRTRLDEKGRCRVCREMERAERLARRRDALLEGIGPGGKDSAARAIARQAEEAELAAARALVERLAAEVRGLEAAG